MWEFLVFGSSVCWVCECSSQFAEPHRGRITAVGSHRSTSPQDGYFVLNGDHLGCGFWCLFWLAEDMSSTQLTLRVWWPWYVWGGGSWAMLAAVGDREKNKRVGRRRPGWFSELLWIASMLEQGVRSIDLDSGNNMWSAEAHLLHIGDLSGPQVAVGNTSTDPILQLTDSCMICMLGESGESCFLFTGSHR